MACASMQNMWYGFCPGILSFMNAFSKYNGGNASMDNDNINSGAETDKLLSMGLIKRSQKQIGGAAATKELVVTAHCWSSSSSWGQRYHHRSHPSWKKIKNSKKCPFDQFALFGIFAKTLPNDNSYYQWANSSSAFLILIDFW